MVQKSRSIAMISYHTCPLANEEGKETGGMNIYVLELARNLVRIGYKVDIFTRSHESNDKLVTIVEPNLRVMHIQGGPQIIIPKRQIHLHLDDFTDHLFAFIQGEGFPYDIVHAHYYLSGLVVKKLLYRETYKSIQQVSFILSFHTLAIMKNLVARDNDEKEEKRRIDAEIALSKQADTIIAPSDSEKSYLHYLYNVPLSKISVIPPGVDTKLFHPMQKEIAKQHIGIPKYHRMILFVGRIEPLKGIDVLMYAVKILIKRNSSQPICLYIVGGDVSGHQRSWSSQLKMLNNLRKILAMETSVQFLGEQKQHDLPYFYNAAEMVVMPSHYESFGMVALEAMSCGVPVITTNVTGISSIIDEKHAQFISSVHNPLLLASQMEYLLRNTEKRKIMGTELRNNIFDLSWSNIAERIGCLYENSITK